MSTSTKSASKKKGARSVVISNNDIIYIWWSVPEKIKNCLGFSIHRIVDGKETALPATVGFNVEEDQRTSPQTTDEWPPYKVLTGRTFMRPMTRRYATGSSRWWVPGTT
jgi:hypothetical protein